MVSREWAIADNALACFVKSRSDSDKDVYISCAFKWYGANFFGRKEVSSPAVCLLEDHPDFLFLHDLIVEENGWFDSLDKFVEDNGDFMKKCD